MKFKEKIVKCQSDEIEKISEETLERWIISLLKRMKVDESKIDKTLYDVNYSKRDWRVELFYNHGIEIIKYVDRVVITKHSSDNDDLILGEWKPPTIVRIKQGKESFCELHLNYWQIV